MYIKNLYKSIIGRIQYYDSKLLLKIRNEIKKKNNINTNEIINDIESNDICNNPKHRNKYEECKIYLYMSVISELKKLVLDKKNIVNVLEFVGYGVKKKFFNENVNENDFYENMNNAIEIFRQIRYDITSINENEDENEDENKNELLDEYFDEYTDIDKKMKNDKGLQIYYGTLKIVLYENGIKTKNILNIIENENNIFHKIYKKTFTYTKDNCLTIEDTMNNYKNKNIDYVDIGNFDKSQKGGLFHASSKLLMYNVILQLSKKLMDEIVLSTEKFAISDKYHSNYKYLTYQIYSRKKYHFYHLHHFQNNHKIHHISYLINSL